MPTTSPLKRIVIVEDQTAIREMLAEILRIDQSYKIVGECGDGQEACALLLDLKPDVLVLDARLPNVSGVDILRRVGKQLKGTRVLVFSAYETPALVREMLENGAHGFVEKTAGLAEFKKGLETVAEGGTYFGPGVAALLRNVVANNNSNSSGGDPLTDREREILKLVAESHSTKEIAQKLGISVKTVDNHRTNLMRKLNLHDVASLTRYALEIGLVDQRA
ncbi:MAG: response regulator [Opitutales bacterium]